MNYKTILSDPTEFKGPEAIKCCFCHNDLDDEEITENEDEKNKYCNDCFYSCCGDELDQDNRRCPTCKENN